MIIDPKGQGLKENYKLIYVLSDTPQNLIEREAYWYCKNKIPLIFSCVAIGRKCENTHHFFNML